jgi:hypothetical protein
LTIYALYPATQVAAIAEFNQAKNLAGERTMTALQKENLAILIPGTTHVLERNGKEAYVYFDNEGAAHMLLDDGEARSGRWRMLDGGYVADWENGTTGRWTLDHEPGAMTYVNQDNAVRFRMIGVLFGNAKELPRQPA